MSQRKRDMFLKFLMELINFRWGYVLFHKRLPFLRSHAGPLLTLILGPLQWPATTQTDCSSQQ